MKNTAIAMTLLACSAATNAGGNGNTGNDLLQGCSDL
jgi:hypothetical protein